MEGGQSDRILHSDPYEKNNLIEQNREIAEDMMESFDSMPKAKIISLRDANIVSLNAAPLPKGPGGPGDAAPDHPIV